MDFYGFNHAFPVQLFHSGFLIIDKMSSSLEECAGDEISPSHPGFSNQRVNRFPLENPATDGIPPPVVDLTQEE
jgi:hypothetical protein